MSDSKTYESLQGFVGLFGFGGAGAGLRKLLHLEVQVELLGGRRVQKLSRVWTKPDARRDRDIKGNPLGYGYE